MLQTAAAENSDTLIVLVQYGAVGVLALLAVAAFLRSDKRLAAITDKFLAHMEHRDDAAAAERSAAISVAKDAAEANLAVANTLVRLEQSMTKHEAQQDLRYREERNDAVLRHKDLLDKFDNRSRT